MEVVAKLRELAYFAGNQNRVKKIDHVGIAVRDIKKAKALFEDMLGTAVIHEEHYKRDNILIAFIAVGDTKVELLQPVDETSLLHKHIEKRGEGMHHVAFEVTDIRAEMANLKKKGFQLLTDEPYVGSMNKLVCFIHPKSVNGVLTEICQKQ